MNEKINKFFYSYERNKWGYDFTLNKIQLYNIYTIGWKQNIVRIIYFNFLFYEKLK